MPIPDETAQNSATPSEDKVPIESETPKPEKEVKDDHQSRNDNPDSSDQSRLDRQNFNQKDKLGAANSLPQVFVRLM
jgi:hypothetical protein